MADAVQQRWVIRQYLKDTQVTNRSPVTFLHRGSRFVATTEYIRSEPAEFRTMARQRADDLAGPAMREVAALAASLDPCARFARLQAELAAAEDAQAKATAKASELTAQRDALAADCGPGLAEKLVEIDAAIAACSAGSVARLAVLKPLVNKARAESQHALQSAAGEVIARATVAVKKSQQECREKLAAAADEILNELYALQLAGEKIRSLSGSPMMDKLIEERMVESPGA